MVAGKSALRRRLRALPAALNNEVRLALERSANEVVAEMNALRPMPEIVVAWIWGAAPEGSLAVGRVAGASGGDLFITIYATATSGAFPQGFAALARWAEFGTAPRRQKTTGRATGRITASPYFFPVYRANKGRVRGRISRAVRKAARKV